MKKIVILTGSGISVYSGLETYRDENGLWNKYNQEIVSNIKEKENPESKEFRKIINEKISKATPSFPHLFIRKLEEKNEVDILTMNIDKLHTKAGSSSVIELHGNYKDEIILFGEDIKDLDKAIPLIERADVFISIGTSDSVYPECDFVLFTKPFCERIQINKEETRNTPFFEKKFIGDIKETLEEALRPFF